MSVDFVQIEKEKMFFLSNVSIYVLPLLALTVLFIIGLIQSRNVFPKRQRRRSKNSFPTISILPQITRIPFDDEDLIQSDIVSQFDDLNSIALRLEQYDIDHPDN